MTTQRPILSNMIKRIAIDPTPTYKEVPDRGCEVSASCLTCPLPQCKHDNPYWFQAYQRAAKDRGIVLAMRRDGLTAAEAAQRFSVTVRTVFRTMARFQEAA